MFYLNENIDVLFMLGGGGGVNGWRSQSCKMTQLPFLLG